MLWIHFKLFSTSYISLDMLQTARTRSDRPLCCPNFRIVVFDELRVVLVLCLEVSETATQHEDFMRDVFAFFLQQATSLGVDLHFMSLLIQEQLVDNAL